MQDLSDFRRYLQTRGVSAGWPDDTLRKALDVAGLLKGRVGSNGHGTVEKAFTQRKPLTPDEQRASDEWLKQHAEHEKRIQAAAFAFFVLFMEDLKHRAKLLLQDGKEPTPENVEKLIDAQIVARNMRDAVLPEMIAAAIAGAKAEWQKFAPQEDFAPIAQKAEEEAKRKADFPFWLLLAGLLRDRAVRAAANIDPEVRQKPIKFGQAFDEEARKTNEAAAKGLGTTGATGFTGMGQDVGRSGLLALGLLVRKKWVSREDAHVRPTHQEAHGQIVSYGGQFEVGGYLCDYPCDPKLPMHEKAGCRCRAITLIDRLPVREAAWDEEKHPRSDDGKFGAGSNSLATPDSSTPDHAATVDAWMAHEQNAHVDAATRDKIGKALHDTLKAMPAPMAKAAVDRMNGPPKLYSSLDEVTAEFEKRGEQVAPDEKVSGFYSLTEKRIHIDHGWDGSHEDAVHIYSHEFGHCINEDNHLSRHPDWVSAWGSEINRHGGPLSEYARQNPSEGLSEYVRALATQPAEAKRFFPRCHSFLEKQGLV